MNSHGKKFVPPPPGSLPLKSAMKKRPAPESNPSPSSPPRGSKPPSKGLPVGPETPRNVTPRKRKYSEEIMESVNENAVNELRAGFVYQEAQLSLQMHELKVHELNNNIQNQMALCKIFDEELILLKNEEITERKRLTHKQKKHAKSMEKQQKLIHAAKSTSDRFTKSEERMKIMENIIKDGSIKCEQILKFREEKSIALHDAIIQNLRIPLIQEKIKENNTKEAELGMEISSLRRDFKSLTSQFSRENCQLNSQIGEVKTLVNNKQNDVIPEEQYIFELDQAILKTEKELSERMDEIKSSDEKIEQYPKLFEEFKTDEEYEKLVNEMENKIQKVKEENQKKGNKTDEENQQLKNRVNCLNSQKEDLRKCIQQNEERNVNLNFQVTAGNQEILDLQDKIVRKTEENRIKLEERKRQKEKKIEEERLENERIAKLEAEKIAKLEAEKIEKLEAEKIAKLEAERIAKLEAELIAAEELENKRIEEENRLAAQLAEFARLETEKISAEIAVIESERIAKEQLEFARIEAEKIAAEEAEKIAAEEAEKIAAEEAEKIAAEEAEIARQKSERIAAEQAKQARVRKYLAEKMAAEQAEIARKQAEKIAAKQAEIARIQAKKIAEEQAEIARIEAEKIAEEEIENARLEAERIAVEKAEIQRQKVEAEKIAEEKAEIARQKAEAKRIAKEKAEKIAAEKAEIARQKAEAKKIAAEKAEIARQKAEAERIAAEKAEIAREKVEAQKIAAEKRAAEKAELERIQAEKLEAERMETERIKEENLRIFRVEAEKSAAENAKNLEKKRAKEAERQKNIEDMKIQMKAAKNAVNQTKTQKTGTQPCYKIDKGDLPGSSGSGDKSSDLNNSAIKKKNSAWIHDFQKEHAQQMRKIEEQRQKEISATKRKQIHGGPTENVVYSTQSDSDHSMSSVSTILACAPSGAPNDKRNKFPTSNRRSQKPVANSTPLPSPKITNFVDNNKNSNIKPAAPPISLPDLSPVTSAPRRFFLNRIKDRATPSKPKPQISKAPRKSIKQVKKKLDAFDFMDFDSDDEKDDPYKF